MSRRQQRERPPAAHQRDFTLHDPEDHSVAPTHRLISARAILTRYVRAVDLLESYEAAQSQRITNPLEFPDAPHAEWARQFKKAEFKAREWDQNQLDKAQRLVGDDSLGRVDARSGHTQRRTPRVWPPHVTYGSEKWIQLRWRPFWLLDQGQKWMDRFELGEYWWQDIYNDPRFSTERAFDTWRNNLKTGHRGVIWSAPTDSLDGARSSGGGARDGRLEEPALAVVVVSSTRWPRRTARWPLFLPKPEWPPELRDRYVDERYAEQEDWSSLSARLDALASASVTDVESLARRSLQARIDARRKRRR
jgi:hypothetical protein